MSILETFWIVAVVVAVIGYFAFELGVYLMDWARVRQREIDRLVKDYQERKR